MVRDAVRRMREQDDHHGRLLAALEIGEGDIAAGRTVSCTPELLKQIEQEARAHAANNRPGNCEPALRRRPDREEVGELEPRLESAGCGAKASAMRCESAKTSEATGLRRFSLGQRGLKSSWLARACESAVAADALPAQSKTRTESPGALELRNASWTAAGSVAPRRFRAGTGLQKSAVESARAAPNRRTLFFGAAIPLKTAKNLQSVFICG